jgi:hypothetical protein
MAGNLIWAKQRVNKANQIGNKGKREKTKENKWQR